MKTIESIRKEVWNEVFEKMKLYTMWRPEMIEKVAKLYALEVIDEIVKNRNIYFVGEYTGEVELKPIDYNNQIQGDAINKLKDGLV